LSFFPVEFSNFLSSADAERFRGDLESWAAWRKIERVKGEYLALAEKLFINHGEIRSLLDYRLRRSANFAGLKILPSFPRVNDLHIHTNEIGPGFRILHGHSTWVLAERIGKNFDVSQNVTIGIDRSGKPTIGDDVTVRTGAVITGGIKIGNNVVIGPNAFVSIDVPDNMVVLPAPIVMKPRRRN
jgi:serine O-acetyltransferase